MLLLATASGAVCGSADTVGTLGTSVTAPDPTTGPDPGTADPVTGADATAADPTAGGSTGEGAAGGVDLWFILLRLACRSSASSRPNAMSTSSHGKTAAVISPDRLGKRRFASWATPLAATTPSSRMKHSHAYTRLGRPAPRSASTAHPAITSIASQLKG